MAHAGGLERVRAKGGYLVKLDKQMLEGRRIMAVKVL
jgi:hypothetical protein